MTNLNIVAPDRNAASIAESIAEHGYVIIEALATDLTNRARDELAADIAAAPFGLDEYLGKRTKRVGSLHGIAGAGGSASDTRSGRPHSAAPLRALLA